MTGSRAHTTRDRFIMSWRDASEYLNGKHERPLPGVATRLHHTDGMRDGPIAVSYRGTDVLTFYSKGDVKLDSGGWRTVTTKARMNQYLPDGYVYQEKYEWYFMNPVCGVEEFRDGMVV